MHKLDLYRLAVQHPEAEVAFALRAHAHGRPARQATRLKEDFAGSAAVAALWTLMDRRHESWAVERHGPTARFAQARCRREMGDAAARCHVIQADVRHRAGPPVDIVLALNFSVLIFHQRDELRQYFQAARRSLRPGGVLVVDVYGGPGALRPMLQKRAVAAAPEEGIRAFEYQWEQRGIDAVSGRVDNRIHFRLGRRVMKNAFRYDWRLWSLPELTETMREAGFRAATVWCDTVDRRGRSDGVYRPQRRLAMREDWVAYVVGRR